MRGLHECFQEHLLASGQHLSSAYSNFNNVTKGELVEMWSALGSIEI